MQDLGLTVAEALIRRGISIPFAENITCIRGELDEPDSY